MGCDLRVALFVLVHGRLGRRARLPQVPRSAPAACHEVFTPRLIGVGERVHLTSPQVCLTTHVTDVVNTVLYEDLHGIVLLGFSYGGFVITGALKRIGDRVRHLVYLDAFVPGDGDRAGATAGGRAGPGAIEVGRDWLVPPPPREFDDRPRRHGRTHGARRSRSAASPSRCG